MRGKPRQITKITVREFFERYGEMLGMELVAGGDEGMERAISEPTVNRPGLALAGFFTYFAKRRVQVLGNSEMSYLKSLAPEVRADRLRALCESGPPCLVLSRGSRLEQRLLDAVAAQGLCVFSSPMITMKFINKATLKLEWEFAPVASEHGCMVDVRGIGVMVRGSSGTGKSESVLGLVERGASLVADDLVHLRLVGGELIGTSPQVGRSLMEVRGLGLINVHSLFGVAAVRLEKRLDCVITLRSEAALNDVDRLGVRRETVDILGVQLPNIEIPVAPGRDVARLIEVAALDQKLRSLGHDTLEDFNRRLIESMSGESGPGAIR